MINVDNNDVIEMDLDDLVDALSNNVSEDLKTFDDLVNLDGAINREIYLGDIGGSIGTSVAGYIRFWNRWDETHNIPVEKRVPIKIFIDSAGGDLGATFTMIDAIKLSKTPVWTINEGAAYSGGFFTFIVGHKRFAYKYSTFLYHEGSAGNEGTAVQFQNFSDFYKKRLGQLKNVVLDHTKISEEKYNEIKKDDFWMMADEALELGVCDEILTEAFT